MRHAFFFRIDYTGRQVENAQADAVGNVHIRSVGNSVISGITLHGTIPGLIIVEKMDNGQAG
jgi:hypothetical protein